MKQIFLDSSALLAAIIRGDSHHNDVISLLEFILNKYIKPFGLKGIFIINDLVYIESLSKLIHKGDSDSKAKKKLDEFLKKYRVKILKRNGDILEEAVMLYKNNARYKFKNLQCNDFIILADSIRIKSFLVTCDEHFLKLKPGKYKDIYYASSKSKKYKDQYIELLESILKSINK